MGLLLIRYKYILLSVVILTAAISGLLIYPNFHTVIPNEIYRSAQLNKQELNHYINQHQIKTIINLRGIYNDDRWYQDELSVSRHDNVAHYDLDLPAHGITSPDNMRMLARILLTAPKPILIHCWRGADRTGLAAAMSLILLHDVPLSVADQQLSWEYGAIASDNIGKEEFHYYETWLHKNHLKSSRENFMRWLAQLKSDIDYPYQS